MGGLAFITVDTKNYKHLSKPERKFIGLLVLMLCAPSEITIEFYHDAPDHYKDEGF